jgi:polyisoprenoid-binding protein YceI
MTNTANTTKWALDTSHSEVQFKVKHLVISTVTGTFKVFDGEMETTSGDFSDAKISFKIDAASIDTNAGDRDGHLRSDDFFATDKYPHITFESRSFKKISDSDYKLTGDLTIRDVTKPIELSVEYGGTVVDPYGNTKAGFEVTGKINRKEFGLTWSAVTEAGGVVVSDDIKMFINVQFVKQQ